MALSSTPIAGPAGVAQPGGDTRRAFALVTFDASYPTGGYAVSPSLFGLTQIAALDANPSSAAHPVVWNPATGKLQVFTAQGTEVADTTDIHTVTCLVEAIGF